MAQLRRSACICYQSKEFVYVIHKIEKEIECGLIAVRQEKHILADLGKSFCSGCKVQSFLYRFKNTFWGI